VAAEEWDVEDVEEGEDPPQAARITAAAITPNAASRDGGLNRA